MAEQTINPCPFCGDDEVGLAEDNGYHEVLCRFCAARGPYRINAEDAIAKWNAATPRVEPGKLIPLDLWTKRDELAKAAMRGLLAQHLSGSEANDADFEPIYAGTFAEAGGNPPGERNAVYLARDAYIIADAMLAERAKQESPA